MSLPEKTCIKYQPDIYRISNILFIFAPDYGIQVNIYRRDRHAY